MYRRTTPSDEGELTGGTGGGGVAAAEFLHVKPGKGSAFVRTKLKNYITGMSQVCVMADSETA